jgi:hypothetical protein
MRLSLRREETTFSAIDSRCSMLPSRLSLLVPVPVSVVFLDSRFSALGSQFPFLGFIFRSLGTCFRMARRSRSYEARGTFRPMAEVFRRMLPLLTAIAIVLRGSRLNSSDSEPVLGPPLSALGSRLSVSPLGETLTSGFPFSSYFPDATGFAVAGVSGYNPHCPRTRSRAIWGNDQIPMTNDPMLFPFLRARMAPGTGCPIPSGAGS